MSSLELENIFGVSMRYEDVLALVERWLDQSLQNKLAPKKETSILDVLPTTTDKKLMREVITTRYTISHFFTDFFRMAIDGLEKRVAPDKASPLSVLLRALKSNLKEELGEVEYGNQAEPHELGRRRLLNLLHAEDDPAWNYEEWKAGIGTLDDFGPSLSPAVRKLLMGYKEIIMTKPLAAPLF